MGALILAGPVKPGPAAGVAAGGDAAPATDDHAGDAAAQALLDAIKTGDAKAVHGAFHALAETCYPELAKGEAEPDADDVDAVGKG